MITINFDNILTQATSVHKGFRRLPLCQKVIKLTAVRASVVSNNKKEGRVRNVGQLSRLRETDEAMKASVGSPQTAAL